MAGYNTTVNTPVVNTSIVFDFPVEAGSLPKEVFFVLYNQSPFVCEVSTTYDMQFCAAFTADVYVVPRNPFPKIVVTPRSNLGADDPIASQLYGTWYTSRDDIPLTTVPASLFGSTESISVDNPKLLAVELNRSVQFADFTSGLIDVRRFQSFSMKIQYEAVNAGPPANTGIVELKWTDGGAGNILYHSSYEINSINSTDCGETHIVDGMHGPFMFYILRPGNGGGIASSTFSGVLYGSSRPVDQSRLQESGDGAFAGFGPDRVLLALGNTVITPAVNLERNCRIGSGSGTFVIQTGAGGGSHDVVLYSPELGINGGRVYTANIPAGINNRVDRLTLPRRALALFVNNNAAVNSTVWIALFVDGDM